MDRTLLLVTGAGRSGTSTIAGTLSLLGLHVPGPYLKTNESNPKGFYESRWSVVLHNQLLKRANVGIADGRPDALDAVREAVRPRERERIREWLVEQVDGHPVTVLKDPRTYWTLDLWQEACDELGIDLAVLTMLRHPAQVVGSRSTHYAADIGAMGELGFRVRNLAGWVNAVGITESRTRGWRRTFVPYDDLLADWRATARRIGDRLDLHLDVTATNHAVDDFIDPGLSRHQLTWHEVEMLPGLRDVADRVWHACCRLVDRADDPEALATMDAAQADYARMFSEARMLVQDSVTAQATAARRAGARRARRRLQAEAEARRVVPRLARAGSRIRRRLRPGSAAADDHDPGVREPGGVEHPSAVEDH